MSKDDLFNPVNRIETTRTWLSLISDTRESIDYGTVVNLIKSIYAMREHKDAMVEESLDNSIEMVLFHGCRVGKVMQMFLTYFAAGDKFKKVSDD